MKMNDNDIECLLGGFCMTGAPPRLRQRISVSASGLLMSTRLAMATAEAASTLLGLTGFGYLSLVVDRIAGRGRRTGRALPRHRPPDRLAVAGNGLRHLRDQDHQLLAGLEPAAALFHPIQGQYQQEHPPPSQALTVLPVFRSQGAARFSALAQ